MGIEMERARMGGCLGWRVQLGERGGSLGLLMYDMRWVGEIGNNVEVAVRVCGIGRYRCGTAVGVGFGRAAWG